MVRRYLPVLFLICAAQTARAQDICTAPVPPAPLNGAEASAEQLRAAIASARQFIGQANLYESCLRDELAAAQARGDRAGPAADRETAVRISANRKLKDKVSTDAASALDAYKKAHPD